MFLVLGTELRSAARKVAAESSLQPFGEKGARLYFPQLDS